MGTPLAEAQTPDGEGNLIGSSAGLGVIDPLLGPLQDNGGPTFTHALLQGSSAIDAGDPASVAGEGDIPAFDQRGEGFGRIVDGNNDEVSVIDIGAFEFVPVASLPLVDVDVSDEVVLEGDGSLVFTLSIAEPIDQDIEVFFLVEGANGASDFFVSPTNVLTIPQGQVSAAITISLLDDLIEETAESITITLEQPANALIDSTSFSVVIEDDDVALRDTRILTPVVVAGPQLIVGDNTPTGIVFQSLANTTIAVTSIGTAVVGEEIIVVDSSLHRIDDTASGSVVADLKSGELYAILFPAQAADRVFRLHSSAGLFSLSSFAGTNLFSPTDVNADGATTALDALLVLNQIRSGGLLAGSQQVSGAEGEFYDVNQDGIASPLDALLVINKIARLASATLSSEEIAVSSVASSNANSTNRGPVVRADVKTPPVVQKESGVRDGVDGVSIGDVSSEPQPQIHDVAIADIETTESETDRLNEHDLELLSAPPISHSIVTRS